MPNANFPQNHVLDFVSSVLLNNAKKQLFWFHVTVTARADVETGETSQERHLSLHDVSLKLICHEKNKKQLQSIRGVKRTWLKNGTVTVPWTVDTKMRLF